MKHKYLTFMLFILMSWAASVTLAYDAYIDGVYYYLNSSAETATVTYYSSSSSSNASAYSGGVFIPEAVTYNGKTYSVTAIRVAAFSGCSGLTSITIPNSVTSIDETAFYGCI